MTIAERLARRVALAMLARMREGQLTVVEPSGESVFGNGDPRAVVDVRSARVWPKTLANTTTFFFSAAGDWPRRTWKGCGTRPT